MKRLVLLLGGVFLALLLLGGCVKPVPRLGGVAIVGPPNNKRDVVLVFLPSKIYRCTQQSDGRPACVPVRLIRRGK